MFVPSVRSAAIQNIPRHSVGSVSLGEGWRGLMFFSINQDFILIHHLAIRVGDRTSCMQMVRLASFGHVVRNVDPKL